MGQNRERWALGLVAGLTLAVAAGRRAEGYFSSTWFEDASGYAAALRQQKFQHVPLLIYFRVDWCPHCRALDDMLEQYEVRSRLNEIIKVRVNPEHGDAEKQIFEAEFGSHGFPSLFIVSDGGSPTRISHAGPPARFVAQLP